jgi:hypothetical protein
MAKQKSIIKLEGTIGDITFVKTKDGYLAKEKTSMNGQRIASDPAFQRTRENNAEFGRAGKAGKLLRNALRSQLKDVSDNRMVSRLTSEMIRVLQADAVNERGQRNVLEGDLSLLTGFDFNIQGKLSTTFYARYAATIDRTAGDLTVFIPPFIPAHMVAAPSGTTHFRILAAGAAVDFGGGGYESDAQESVVLPWNATATLGITLTCSVPGGSTDPLFLLLGIEFLQEVNSGYYPLKNGAHNAMAVVAVDLV